MDPESPAFIIIFHLLQPQPPPDPPTPSTSPHRVPSQHPPALLAAMTQSSSSSCWGYKRIKSFMKNSQESDFSQWHTMRHAPAEVDVFYSLIHPWQPKWWGGVECLKNSFPLLEMSMASPLTDTDGWFLFYFLFFWKGKFVRHAPYMESNESSLSRQNWRTVVLIKNHPISANFWHRMYGHYFHSGQNDSDSDQVGDHFCFLHVWVFPPQSAYAQARTLEPVGCEELALLIMQTECSIMDRKRRVTKMRDCVTWPSRQREWEVRLTARPAGGGFWTKSVLSCRCLPYQLQSSFLELLTGSRFLELKCCMTQSWTRTAVLTQTVGSCSCWMMWKLPWVFFFVFGF